MSHPIKVRSYFRIIILILSLAGLNNVWANDSIPHARTLMQEADTLSGNLSKLTGEISQDLSKDWWHLLKKGKLDMNDKTVHYPKFLDFCARVYRWGDKAFNGVDSTYIVGTGRRWKVRLVSDNWSDSYTVDLDKKLRIHMLSDFYCNVGVYLQYMAVSVGYSFDFTNILTNRPGNHKKMEFGFNCARFTLEGHYWENSDGTYIRSFGDYNGGKPIKRPFYGLNLRAYGATGYYFFNNHRYSQGAAYSFSKIQKKSAGSWIAGLAYNNVDIHFDFDQLPLELIPSFTLDQHKYKFHYRSYTLEGGYGFNWVWNRHLLFNITAIPGIGFARSYSDHSDYIKNSSTSFSSYLKGMSSITYNAGDIFVCAIAKVDGNWYNSRKYNFLSTIYNLQISAGVRF